MRRAYIMRPRIANANHYIYKNHTNNIYDHLHTTQPPTESASIIHYS